MSKELLEQLEGTIGKLESKFSGVEDLKSEFATLKASVEAGKTQGDALKVSLESITAQLKEIQEEQSSAKEQSKGVTPSNVLAKLEDELKALMPKIKEKAKANKISEIPYDIELTVSKAAIDMFTTAFANASLVSTPVSYVYQRDFMGVAEDARGLAILSNLVARGSTNRATLAIADKVATEGNMAVTSEGALKPLISFAIKTTYSEAKKIAGRVKVTEEALDDIPFLMTMIRTELLYQHEMALQAQMVTSINAIAPTFAAGALAASTPAPNNYDAIRAAIYSVKIASKGRHIPNAVIVASADKYAMGATKDSSGQYVLPTFVLPDGSRIEGVRLVEDATGLVVTAGNILVGDFSKFHVDEYQGFTIRIGQGIVGSSTAANIKSDFECNMLTIIGESRHHFWNFSNQTVAFVKGSLSSIKTAIEAPEPEPPAQG